MSLTGEVSRARLEKNSQVVTTNREKSAEVIVADRVKKSVVGEGLNF